MGWLQVLVPSPVKLGLIEFPFTGYAVESSKFEVDFYGDATMKDKVGTGEISIKVRGRRVRRLKFECTNMFQKKITKFSLRPFAPVGLMTGKGTRKKTKVDRSPTLSERSVGNKAGNFVRFWARMPVATFVVHELIGCLSKEGPFGKTLMRCFKNGTYWTGNKDHIAKTLDKHLQDKFYKWFSEELLWDGYLELIRIYAINYLSNTDLGKSANQTKMTMLETLRQLLNEITFETKETHKGKYKYLGPRALDLVPELKDMKYSYKVKLKGDGAVIPVPPVFNFGGFDGTISFNRIGHDKVKSDGKTWGAFFSMTFNGLTASIGRGVSLTIEGKGATGIVADRWIGRDFDGVFSLVQAGAEGGAGPATGAGSLCYLFVSSGSRPKTQRRLRFNLSGVGKGGLIAGASAGAGVFAGVGNISSVKPTARSRRRERQKAMKFIYLFGSKSKAAKAHFRFGCAYVPDAARDMIRRFCALELPLIVSKHATIVIEAHTDTKDCERRNIELSRLRAQNVEATMRSVVGEKMKCRVVIVPHGEAEARKRGLAPEEKSGNMTESQRRAWDEQRKKWRRVNVLGFGAVGIRIMAM